MRNTITAFVILLLVIVGTGCGGNEVPGQGISGMVLLGPHCPVVQEGEECADTLFETQLVVMNVDGTRVIEEFSSDANGEFEVLLPVGEYVIRSPGNISLPYCDSGPVAVSEGTMTEIVVYCDTGIR